MADIESAKQFKLKGNSAFKRRDFQKAIEFYSKAIDLDDKEPSYFTNRAACYLQTKSYKKALKDSESAERLDGENIKAFYRMGQANIALGNFLKAKLNFDKVLSLESKNKGALNELDKLQKIKEYSQEGNQKLEKQDYAGARISYQLALKQAPFSAKLRLLVAEAELGEQKFDSVISYAKSLLKEDPSSGEAYFLYGRASYYKGDNAAGLKYVTKALQMDPDNKEAIKFRKTCKRLENAKKQGNELFKASKLDEAYNKYKEATEIDPLNNSINASLFSNMCAVSQKKKNWEQGVQDATEAIKRNPKYVKALLRRGSCYIELKRYEEATYDFSAAQREDKNNPSIAQKLRQAQQLLRKQEKKDYYKILNIERDATEREIKKAYRKLAAKNHPDKFPDEEEKKKAEIKFKEITEAYNILSDKKKKNMYDRGIDPNSGDSGFDMGDFGGLGPFMSMFNGMGGQGMGGMGGQGMPFFFQNGGSSNGQTFSFSFQ